jgi:alpha-glucoside transport system substrate-binding protein
MSELAGGSSSAEVLGGYREPRNLRPLVVALVIVGALNLGLGGDGLGPSVGAAACASFVQYGHLRGTAVSIYSDWVAPLDQRFLNSVEPFERCTGAKIDFEPDVDFEARAARRIGAGFRPDLVFVSQPGLYRQLVATGLAKVAPPSVVANLNEFWAPQWRNPVTVDGKVYGAPLSANVKSLVWYSPRVFAQNGYAIPKTLDQLTALSDLIVSQGVKPWCEGIEQGYASGWPITDWMEDMMLRVAGPVEYDKWVSHTIAFDAPGPTAALNAVGSFLKNPHYVNAGFGGVSSIVTTSTDEAGQWVIGGTCTLHRAPSLYAWPAGINVSPQGDVFAFYLPAKDTDTQPVLVGGDFTLALSDRPEVRALQTYLSSDAWANSMASAAGGDWASANFGLQSSRLSPINQLAVHLLQDPKSVLRFDGSDQMPPAIGMGVFWKQAVRWMDGQQTNLTLRNIERAWPHS